MRIFSSLVLLAVASCPCPAGAQSLVSQVTLSTVGAAYRPYGAGYAQGNAYFCAGEISGAVWKVATGNANGPSTTAPSEINSLVLSDVCFDGAVDSIGVGYWVLHSTPIILAKTQGNAGNAPMTLVGEYTFPSGASPGTAIALDEVNNKLYVGDYGNVLYKLDAGAPSALPLVLNSLTLDGSDGDQIFGLAVDPANGYGYAGTASSSYNIIKFSLGAGSGAMTRIGAVATANDIYGMGLNTATGALYSGFYSNPPDAEMFRTGTGAALPTSVGTFNFAHQALGGGIYTNKAFVVNTQCNYLFVAANSVPAEINFFDLTNGTVLPTFKTALTLPTDRGLAGAIDEYGYSYFTTRASPVVVYKISAPQCSGPNPQGGSITLTGAKLPRTHAGATPKPALSGRTLKVQFQLTRWNAGIPVRRQLAGAHHNKTAGGLHSKVWENYNLTIALPGAPDVTLLGKPRVSPLIAKSKGPAVADNSQVAWTNVPMLVNAAKKNYTRKFTIATKVAKTVVGNLTFSAVATGPNDAKRTFALTVPVVARK